MSDDKVALWRGRPIERLTREELEAAFNHVYRQLRDTLSRNAVEDPIFVAERKRRALRPH